ncbi:MAG: enhanced serine sensitivity protein SseB C-terminal domain-containing protein [Deltaproteobacteria bacterium]|nr:enhanced serine sensitivity protein SseB C-terminal domain-containing protein [Deltaproteobacteria bacterium]
MSEANPLMEALRKAADEPGARAAFYELLMKSTVFVPGVGQDGPDGPQVRFKQWPQPEGFMAIPFFPDLEDLKKVLSQDESHIAIPALELFRLTRGTTLVLTDVRGLSKAFKPDEIDFILSSELAMDPLAAALERAVREENEEARGAFYQVLLNSQVFVFGEPRTKEGESIPEGPRPLGPDDKFTIATISHPQNPEERVIPFFSSGDLLHRAAKGANLPPQTTFLGFSALNLLKMAKGMGRPLVLNLGPMTYKFFNLEEIKFLLANVKPKGPERRELEAGSRSFLSTPADYPQELVGALLDFLPGYPNIKAAYLASRGEPPVEVLGLEAEEGSDWDEIIREIAPGEDKRVIRLRRPGQDGLSRSILEKIKPFYQRPDESGPETAEEDDAPAGKFFSHVNEAGGKVFLAPPEDPKPAEALLDLMPGLPNVKAAYLAALSEEPVLLIGLETEEDAKLEEMINAAANLVTRHAPEGRAIDFTLIRPGENNGLGQLLLKHINPFYRRPLARGDKTEAAAKPEADNQASPPASPGFFGRLTRIFKN